MLQDRQARRHALSERGDDLYETPRQATEALLGAERLPAVIWEPACGNGAISEVLKAAGHYVISTDLIDYGYGQGGRNFLFEREAPPRCSCIVTNPPFKLAEDFVAHALTLCPVVIMLLRLAFYESSRRSYLLEERGLAHIYAFRKRLPMMHRAGWTGPKASSSTAYAWYVWDRSHTGPTTISRISWEA